MNRTHFFLFLFFVSIFSPLGGFGQDVRFHDLSLADGLSQATITTFGQDQDGFMWIGTRDGLNRYDGFNFKVLKHSVSDSTTLSSNQVTTFMQSADKSIWIGTDFGLNKMNPETLESISYYRLFEDSTSLSSNKISSIAQDHEGTIWVGTDNGLNRMLDEKGTFHHYSITRDDESSLSSNVINDIYVDREGQVWIATDGGLNRYDPNTDSFQRFRIGFDIMYDLKSKKVSTLEAGGGDTLWVGTQSGLCFLNTQLESYFQLGRASIDDPTIQQRSIHDLCYDSNGDLWIGTSIGLYRVDGSTLEDLIIYRTSANDFYTLPNDYILNIFEDKSGLMWIGTQSAGISTLNEELPKFTTVNYVNKAGFQPGKNQIFDMCELDKNHLFIATGMGLAVFDLSSRTTEFLTENPDFTLGRIKTPVRSINMMGDSLFLIATDGSGLITYNWKTRAVEHFDVESEIALPTNRINQVIPDNKGNLWLATSGHGVLKINIDTKELTNFGFDISTPNSLRDNNVHAMAMSGDSILWVGTGSSGLYALDLKAEKYLEFNSNEGEANALLQEGINDLYVDQTGKLWIGTAGGGLKCIDKNGNIRTFDSQMGLDSDEVLSVLSDNEGRVWLSTNRGISVFNMASKTFRNFNEKDVRTRNTFNPRSSYRDSNGILYFGGTNGFGYFNVNGLEANTFVPPLVITRVQSLESDYQMNDRDKSGRMDTLHLNHDHAGFTIEFAALNFKQPYKNQYAYRLNGLFNAWRHIGNRRFATFINLDPGQYTFEVIGSNNDGVWNDDPALLKIIVHPAWWKTIWFQSLMAILVIAILYLFYRYKITAQQERNKELEQAVLVRTKEIAEERDTNAVLLREVHHRVKNNLQIIVSLLNLQLRFIEDKKLVNIFREVQNRVRSMSMIHQKMYQTKDLQSVDIEEYITDLSNNLLSTYNLEQEIEISFSINVNKFQSDTLTPLGLIINEVISNALKYAFVDGEKGKIFVSLSKIEGSRHYRMKIGDNGVGMDKSQFEDPSESFGTELISALVEQLNGTIIILDNEGTVYQIDFEDN